jgi:hypothetical protein
MIFKLFLFSFATIPLKNLRIDQADLDFNNALNNILTSIGAIGFLLPKIFKNNERCNTDEDCPFIMRCCEIGLSKYCCTPNNYIKIDLAYQNQEIKKIS